MTVTLRQFQRELARVRRAAANGVEILVRDRAGSTYLFKRIDAATPTVGQIARHLAGSIKTGQRVKSLSGYGRHPD